MIDPAIHHYLFLYDRLGAVSGPNDCIGTQTLKEVNALIAELYVWVGNEMPGVLRSFDLPNPPNEDDPSRVYPLPKERSRQTDSVTGQACFAVVHREYGTVSVHREVSFEGSKDNLAWHMLRSLLARVPYEITNSRFYVGEATCFTARAATEADAIEVIVPAFGLQKGEEKQLRAVHINGVGWLIDRIGQPNTVALIHEATCEAEARAGSLLLGPLRHLWRHLLKIVQQYGRQFSAELAQPLKNEGHALSIVSRSARQSPATPEALEQQVASVARAYGEFAGSVALFEELRNTVGVNAADIGRLIENQGFPIQGVFRAWSGVARHIVEHLESEHRYHEARLREAEITLGVLKVRAEVERGVAERQEKKSLDRLLVIIAVLGAILAFASDEFIKAMVGDKEPSVGQQFLAKIGVVAGFIVLGLIFWWLRRPEGEGSTSQNINSR